MAKSGAGELLGRIVAFIFAGCAAGFGVAVLIDWVASLLRLHASWPVVAAGVAVLLAWLAYRLFVARPSDDAEKDEEDLS